MNSFKIRISEGTWLEMSELIFSRYPDAEWATFFQCGWIETPNGFTATVRSLIAPRNGDLNPDVEHVMIDEQYSLRVALGLERTKFGIGFVHSHPEGYKPLPSIVDDDMDSYYPRYFAGFCSDRPYVSIILSKNPDGSLCFSGRASFKGEEFIAEKIEVVGRHVKRVYAENVPPRDPPESTIKRLDRLILGYGKTSARDLWNSTAAIVGCGGTGSPVAHVLARSCVGKIILIDFDRLSWSNFERVHGSYARHLAGPLAPTKAEILRDLISEINPDIEVVIHEGSIFDKKAQMLIAGADFLFGCTDTHSGRVGITDAASRFLLPALHVNVSLESKGEELKAEIIHITQYGPNLPCAYCRDQVDGRRVLQELMSPEERAARIAQAAQEQSEGRKPDQYWLDEPVLATVGPLTTTAGGLAANYGVGMLAGKSKMPSTFLEIDLLALDLGVVSVPVAQRASCMCRQCEGGAAQVESMLGNLE